MIDGTELKAVSFPSYYRSKREMCDGVEAVPGLRGVIQFILKNLVFTILTDAQGGNPSDVRQYFADVGLGIYTRFTQLPKQN